MSLIPEGKKKATGRRDRRLKQPLNELKGTRRCWKLKDKAVDRIFW